MDAGSIPMMRGVAAAIALSAAATGAQPDRTAVDWAALKSPVLFAGTATNAFRDPAACYHEGVFHLFVTYNTIGPDNLVYWQTASSRSRDLLNWTEPRPFTPKDRAKNFSSPGNVVRDGDDFVLCLQTYPTPKPPAPPKPGEPAIAVQYGDAGSRLWTMRSRDLENWGGPELLRVKGASVPTEQMGRMIDPFLLRDKDDPSRWWCFYKQDGQVRYSWSRDLHDWTPAGAGAGGENPCVIVDGHDYVLFYSPATGIGVKRSADLRAWRDEGVLTLGLPDWEWARGRLTAGFVLDLRREPRVGKALLFFHGSRWPEMDPRGGWATQVGIGIAWSDDLKNWDWPGKKKE